jgi:hypothetical protein
MHQLEPQMRKEVTIATPIEEKAPFLCTDMSDLVIGLSETIK